MLIHITDTRNNHRYNKWIRSVASALSAHDLPRAEQYLGLLAQTHPNDAEYLRLRAIAHDARGQTRQAVATMRSALALRPDDAACNNTMACLFDHAYEFDAAVTAAYRAVQLDPRFFTAWYNLSIILAHVGHHVEATAALEQARKLEPGNVAVRTKLAEGLRDRGLVSDAELAYRRIIRERPWTGVAWLGLADLKTIRFNTRDIASMRSAVTSSNATQDDRVAINYSLAKALEDTGDYEGSLRVLALAKADMRRRQPWDAAGFSREVASVLAAFGPLHRDITAPKLGREVIFIVGMPRSGTTLVEQILASHSDVAGGGEITDLIGVLSEESVRRGKKFPEWVRLMGSEDWGRLGRRYIERTMARRQHYSIFTDKLPSNWVFVGAIISMLPAARVVCCRRDPLETCFSNYRQYRTRLEYAGSFSDLATFWNDYDKSINVWCKKYPDNVSEHSYERLLASPERSIRLLLSNCGLPWDRHCLEFWTTQRNIHTPSAMQVREPLFSNASRSERYGKLLDPLRKYLSRY